MEALPVTKELLSARCKKSFLPKEVAFCLLGQASVDYDNIVVQVVPEPSTFALLGMGAIVFAASGKRPRHAQVILGEKTDSEVMAHIRRLGIPFFKRAPA